MYCYGNRTRNKTNLFLFWGTEPIFFNRYTEYSLTYSRHTVVRPPPVDGATAVAEKKRSTENVCHKSIRKRPRPIKRVSRITDAPSSSWSSTVCDAIAAVNRAGARPQDVPALSSYPKLFVIPLSAYQTGRPSGRSEILRYRKRLFIQTFATPCNTVVCT